ncbi:NOVA [Acanthosepion pharaonis]|uniref:NOVA n=1 Tax=Acanthosepion pharaonis TaxID=158019 RepID=A0A812C4X8_ACAPH|nr:NOVA [Sepia pharaonis]
MIIGKGGIYIKQIKEESGAYVQISQKSKETNLPERCVTVAGDVESNRRAVDMILQKIVEDPQSGSCPNISYADYTGPVASANPTGIGNERYGGSPMLNDSFGNATNYASTPGFTGTPSMAGDRSPNVNQNSFGLGTGIYSPADDKSAAATKHEMEVPETIVGAILGPGGKGIVEIQQLTGTNIQISKKGVYVPGTRNRVVTITGTPNNIAKAQILIQRRLQQEEIKRARQASTR